MSQSSHARKLLQKIERRALPNQERTSAALQADESLAFCHLIPVSDFGAHGNAPVETSKDRAGNLNTRDDACLAGDDAGESLSIARHGPSSGQIGFYIYSAEVFPQG